MYSDELLLGVEKPARYVGGEVNAVVKDYEGKTRFAFCFPDVYEVGMSCLALQIIYFLLNSREDAYCERAFAPWVDMEAALRGGGLPLLTVDSRSPLADFDFVGFTLQYEMCYTNVLNMLDLAGIPLFARERGEEWPLICAGGPCAYNPEPMAEFFDFFLIGDGEAAINEILDIYRKHDSKADFLRAICGIDGVYVPAFYDVTYNQDGTIANFAPNDPAAPAVVRRAVVKDLDGAFYPEKPLVPLIETVHDRAALELFRGCPRGCRFCQAGFVGRPVRGRSVDTLVGQAEGLIGGSGYEELSLVSLSTGDYAGFRELADGLMGRFEGRRVALSLPSLRIDAFNLALMERAQGARKSGLTFAPEAGSQRLRDVINKNLSEGEIMSGVRLAYEGGWARVKLYFMAGLPTERSADLLEIAALADRIADEYYKLPKERRVRPVAVNVSSACFVPKPFTPFQWEGQDSAASFRAKQEMVKAAVKRKQVTYNYHGTELSVIEGILARGDRRVAALVLEAWRNGARFDGWTEHFKAAVWKAAMAAVNVAGEFYAERVRERGEALPWDFIDIGVTKDFLWRERERAYAGVTTEDCRNNCAACGLECELGAGIKMGLGAGDEHTV